MEMCMALPSILGEWIRGAHLVTSKLISDSINQNKHIALAGIRDDSLETSVECLAMCMKVLSHLGKEIQWRI